MATQATHQAQATAQTAKLAQVAPQTAEHPQAPRRTGETSEMRALALPSHLKAWVSQVASQMIEDGCHDREWSDTVEPGLGIRIRIAPKSKRVTASFTTRYRVAGRGSTQRRYTLGRFSRVYTLAKAREDVAKARAKVELGEDPQAEKTEQKTSPSFGQFYEIWKKTRIDLKPKTKRGYELSLENYILPEFQHVKLVKMTQHGLRIALSRIARGNDSEPAKPEAANLCMKAVSSVFALAIEEGYCTVNATLGIKKFGKTHARIRYFSDNELGVLWRLWEKENNLGSILFQLTVLTGQRGGELLDMKYTEIHGNFWHQGENKTGNPQTVYLHDEALRLIERARAINQGKGDLVFASRVKKYRKSITVPKDVYRKQREMTGIVDWGMHTGRKTVITGLSRLGCREKIKDKVVNHAENRTVNDRHYDFHRYDSEKEEWMGRWVNHVMAVVS